MKKTTMLFVLLLGLFSLLGNAQIAVGTGTDNTSYFPIYSCYGYTYSQQIYYQSEINSSGDITSVSFYLDPQTSTTTFSASTDWVVYLGHSSKTEFSSTTDWVSISELTQVFSGTVSFPEEGNWFTVTFATPFSYNGTDNLILAVEENQAGYNCSMYWRKTNASVNRGIVYRNDSNNPDPASPPTASSLYTYYNDVVFGGITPQTPPNCDAVLTSPANGETDGNILNGLAWDSATGSPSGYILTMGTTSGGNDVLDAVDVGDVLTYDVTMEAGTTYYVTITPYNANGNAMDCMEESFTTTVLPECPIDTTVLNDCGNYDFDIMWSQIANADGYYVTVGTTSGGTDIADSVDNGGSTAYGISSPMASTTYYATIIAYNSVGESEGCTEMEITTSATQCYCTSETNSIDGQGISNLLVGETNFVSGGTLSYEDFTGASVELAAGLNTNVQITFATGYSYAASVWVDLNDNYEFESEEMLFQGPAISTPNPTVYDASFIMPIDAALGVHRMRIVSDDTAGDILNPCNSTSWHVTMDLDVNIVEAECIPPMASAEVVSDCNYNQFFISIDVTSLGDGSPSITDGTLTWGVNQLGVMQIGPFATGDSRTLTLQHGENESCNMELGMFTYNCPPENDTCDGVVDLGTLTSPLTATTQFATNNFGQDCLTNAGAPDMVYSILVPDGSTIEIGQVSNTYDSKHRLAYGDSCPGDTLIGCIDDPDTEHITWTNNTGEDQMVYWIQSAYSTGSGEFVLEWLVYDCVTAEAVAAAVPDCDSEQFYVDVVVTSFGSLTDLSDGTQTQSVSAAQPLYNFGPYPSGTEVTITAIHTNEGCDFEIGTYDFTCPAGCGEVFYDSGGVDDAYSANENTVTTLYPDIEGDAVTITFTYVDLEVNNFGGGCYDSITVYDGPDDTYPVLAAAVCGEESGDGDVSTTPLSIGDSFTSTDVSGALTIVFTSDGSVQETGWAADISCASLSTSDIEQTKMFSYYPNPVNDKLSIRSQNNIETISVMNMLGQEVMKASPNSISSDVEMSQLQSGAYFVKVTIGNTSQTIRVIKK